MVHELKIKECYWKEVWSGIKTFEIRKNDRDYKVGDMIHFHRIDDDGNELPIRKDFNEKYNNYIITYVFNGGEYGLDNGYCVFGIRQWIKFKADDEMGRVRDLVSLLNSNPMDNILCAVVDDSEESYDITDVSIGSGTTLGITYVEVRTSDVD